MDQEKAAFATERGGSRHRGKKMTLIALTATVAMLVSSTVFAGTRQQNPGVFLSTPSSPLSGPVVAGQPEKRPTHDHQLLTPSTSGEKTGGGSQELPYKLDLRSGVDIFLAKSGGKGVVQGGFHYAPDKEVFKPDPNKVVARLKASILGGDQLNITYYYKDGTVITGSYSNGEFITW